MNVFVGRQPILDVNENIYGYELLYRNGEKNAFPNIDPEKATIELLINTFLSIGKDKIVGKHLSFINFTGSLLSQEIFESLDPEYVVIEILEDVAITPILLTHLQKLKEKGFKLALDDFILQREHKNHLRLFNLIDFIKVDFLHAEIKERTKIEQFAKNYPNIELIAEKVETNEEFQKAKTLGYSFFQGYFFAEPEVIRGFEIPPNVALHFQIIDELNVEVPNIDKIATLIKHDISLSYKLLRLINSPGIGVIQKISSIKQAIVIIGLNEMKKWIPVLALREIGNDKSSGPIQALVNYSLTRAKMCELLADKAGKKNIDEYFLTGLFSLMDVIMQQGWEDILKQIPLSDNVANTLMGVETEMTPYVKLVEAIERFDDEQVDILARELKIAENHLCVYSQQANRWSQLFELK